MATAKKRGRGPRHPTPLVAWMHGRVVGEWSVREGEHRFRYAEAWVADPQAGPLSLSLPLPPDPAPLRGAAVGDWFDNLLPDDDAIRGRLSERLALGAADAFDLLTVLGRDCVGAVQLLPPGATPEGFDRIDATPLDEADVERAIDAALAGGRRRHDDDGFVPVALPGAREKLALLRRDGRWFHPRGATPTTHFLKLPLGRLGHPEAAPRDAVSNEWLCSRVMAAFGLDVAACEIARFGRHEVLVVERFDRTVETGAGPDGDRIVRRPQEDLCQALGVPGARRREADGGPGLRDLLRVLDAGTNAAADKAALVKAQMVFWLLAATDGHAKNHSIVRAPGGRHRLAPFYDVQSVWPVIGGNGLRAIELQKKTRLALALREKSAHWGLSDIGARHWDDVARLAGRVDARALRDEIAERLPEVLRRVEAELPPGFPAPLADAVLGGIRTLAPRLHDID
jgi:serine/threonine-protein kinase HipA